jgi:hypothetical protein
VLYHNLLIHPIPAFTLVGLIRNDFERFSLLKKNPVSAWTRDEQVETIRALIDDRNVDERQLTKYLSFLEEKSLQQSKLAKK